MSDPQQDENPAPKSHRLRPIHSAILDDAQAKAQAIMVAALRLVADDLGVNGNCHLTPGPDGPCLVELDS